MLNELFQAFFIIVSHDAVIQLLEVPMQSSQAGKIFMETLPTRELSWQL